MSNTIQIKRSSTAGSVPSAGSLAQGELAVNLADRKLYTKNASNAVVQLNPVLDGFRNRIINGDMRIDQRNAGAATAGAGSSPYTLDRWKVFSAGANCGVQRVAGFSGFQNAMRVTGVASNSAISVFQRIEAFNAFDLASQTITVSFITNSSVASRSVDVVLQSPTTTTDDFGALTEFARQTITVPNGIATHKVTVTAGTGAIRGVQLVVELGALTSGTIDITGVQLEAGSVASPFERRPYGTELALCQRYFETYSLFNASLIGNSTGTAGAVAVLSWCVTKRAAPTVTLPSAGQSTGTVSFLTSTGGFPAAIGVNSATDATVTKVGITGSSYSGLTAASATIFWSEGASTISISAEL